MDNYGAEMPEQPEGGYTKADLERIGKEWLDKIRAAEKREERWQKDAEEASKAFLNDDDASMSGKVYEFNILHSNIETIAPAIYNSTPVPDIRERFRTGAATPESAISRVVAQVIERAIMVQIDDGALDNEVEMQVQDALVAGRGVVRIRFDADEQEVPGQPILDPMTGAPLFDELGLPMVGPASIALVNERLTFESVSWHNYREGPAKRWEDVPWVAYRHCIPWEEVQRIQDPALKAALSEGGDGYGEEAEQAADTDIWEIWCKASKRVYMIVASSGDVLSMRDDPLGLKGFFPQARPVQPITGSGQRTPVVPFVIYKRLADELDKISRRIMAITDGLKVRGLIAGNTGDIANLAEAGDNELIPVANLEGLAQTGNLQNAIMWWPLEQAIVTLRELYQNREITKNMIYEITGISDIVRGQGAASETATAQEIKSQWGSLRIRKLQRLVERNIREMFVICAEIIAAKFSPDTLQAMTGIQIPREAAQILSQPLDHYRIDVESDSTVRADLSRRKGEMGEFLQGTANFFGTMAPLVQQAPEMAGPIASMYAAFARQFSLGKQAEDSIEELSAMAQQAAQQRSQGPSPQEQAMQAEMQLKQAEMQMKAQEGQAKLQLDGQRVQNEAQIKQAELALDAQKLELERQKLDLDARRLAFEMQQGEMNNGRRDL